YDLKACSSMFGLLENNDQIAEKYAYRQCEKVRERVHTRFAHFVERGALDLKQAVLTARMKVHQVSAVLTGVQISRGREPYKDLLERRIINGAGVPESLNGLFGDETRRVGDVLRIFTPWGVPCIAQSSQLGEREFSDGFDSVLSRDEIKARSLKFSTDRDRREMYRAHALICPDCFRAMAAELFSHTRDVSWLALASAVAVPEFSIDSVHPR
ncbi:MAG: hypothetical protein ACREDR_04260, partial [Blastocatellia bacterium]